MKKLNIKAVCFDMDGLLFNTEELFDEIGTELLKRRGKTIDFSLIQRMMGQQAELALQMFIDHHGLDDLVCELKAETSALFDELLPLRLAPMPGAISLLKQLMTVHQRPMALTTSSASAEVDRIMGICDVSCHFQFRLTAEDIDNSKPHPEIYLRAAERFEIRPDEMLVFEDSENGCRSGVAAGAHVVAVPSKHAELHNFEGCLFVADTLSDPRIAELLGETAGT